MHVGRLRRDLHVLSRIFVLAGGGSLHEISIHHSAPVRVVTDNPRGDEAPGLYPKLEVALLYMVRAL